MARSSIKLIRILRETADRLHKGVAYQWGHMGSCNCGHLAQSITKYNKGTIHAAAMKRYGDWAEQLRDYCPQSGLPLDVIIDKMLEAGLTTVDLAHLERLSDHAVLQNIPAQKGKLMYNVRDDVVLYINTWANLLEDQLSEEVSLKGIETHSEHKLKATVGA